MTEPRPQAARRRDPLTPADFELVLVDGDNLLHRVRGMRDEAGLRWLLPRMRAWLPSGVRAIVMLDGHPDPGDAYGRRVATGVEFQHSGNYDADTALVRTLSARPYADRAHTVVVTDDRQLGDRVRHAGGIARRLDWLLDGLAAAVGEGPVATRAVGVGAGKPPRQPAPGRTGSGQSAGRPQVNPDAGEGGADDTADEREPWKPGRGATKKHGNPRRAPKTGP